MKLIIEQWRPVVLMAAAMVVLAASALGAAAPVSFWVWNRAEPLTADETARLRAAGVERLYWQVGEVELRGGKGEVGLRRTAILGEKAGFAVVPVVRVSTSIRSPEQFTGESLGRALRPVADTAPGREVQLDFDCPDRLLPLYAERLRTARQVADIRRLTITALAGWSDVPAARDAVFPAVDAVYPMLYDVAVDPVPAAGAALEPRPLLDPAALATRLASWGRNCPIPWYAGLPAFSRVTLYDPDGRSRGHLRSWDAEELLFNPALVLDRPVAGGTTLLRATRGTRVGESPVSNGGYAAIRGVELPALRAGMDAAAAAGARGVVLFRLPDPPSLGRSGSGPTLAQLLAPPTAAPHVRLRATGETWALENDSEADLPPRFGPPGRGYGLEMELAGGAAGGWREAQAGDFRRVGAHAFPNGPQTPVPAAIPLARRLTFWFAELPAHATLATGLVQLAPGLDPHAVRYRLPLTEPLEDTPWQTPD